MRWVHELAKEISNRETKFIDIWDIIEIIQGKLVRTRKRKERGLKKILKLLNTKYSNPNIEYKTGIKVDEGWIVGADAGEFGGSLVFVSDNSKIEELLSDSVLGVYKTSAGFFAVTGLNHLGINEGHLYCIDKTKGKWGAKKVLNLCATPDAVDQKV